MKKVLGFMALVGCVVASSAQAAVPKGWFITGSAAADYDIGAEPGTRGPDNNNAFIRARKDTTGFGTLMQTIDASVYRGKRVRFSGFLRTKDANQAGLWMRIDGAYKRVLGFDNMEKRAVHGDSDWQSYSIVLDVPQEAVDIAFGFLLNGKGEVAADNFKLEIVSHDVATTDMPHPQLPNAPVNLNFSP